MKEVLLTGPARTPIGGFNGGLSPLTAVELGEIAVKSTLDRSGVSAENIEEVVVGNVLQAGLGQNPARQIAIHCGVPVKTPALTVNQVCGSGLKAIELAWRSIAYGENKFALAAGIESMSNSPYLLGGMRRGTKLGDSCAVDSVIADGLTDAFGSYHMGQTAELIAEKFQISREEQDQFALESQTKCAAAISDGKFKDEIVSAVIKSRKRETVIADDEHPRANCVIGDLSKLRPAFKKDGSVTAGNASGINDGAASAILVASDNGVKPESCVKIKDLTCVGCEPELMGLGPVPAVKKLLKRQGLSVNDIDLWELNEAFAVQSIAVLKELNLDQSKVNVNGGAIALGHPIGASGARIVVTLFHEMKRRGSALGIASLCVGGGMGLAILLENQ